ncbi:MAG: single-stranded-DNA-specific exonuclease RecJ [Sulfurovum sp.]|nr:single-stranded-DNA-specific exonuclease RecJ [Sulfurovum sp.]MCB4745066.1 single-stranded-DNA-specific exonuclease RecJ [Sulfurovum sp.]MCB4746361.1 single-stranded-DNA-specific exonuclease RecJ [Sulfurovum sp.]MCB4748853.1 single-stranded-DNA-specific exonuclease RecJ [Sulfurovum sp.]MCB4751366.1 single-stranded-DNA-specific exonuclease RecJ [Sulfurovum sp.]
MSNSLTLDALEKLLYSRFKEGFLTLKDLPQPHVFKDMQCTTERIISAIKNKEKIIIIGDYDVDGVIATTLMKLFFEEINYPVKWIIPNRFKDGYGLSEKIIPHIVGTDLAITVDNGISAINAAKRCKILGIDLIITDHHLLPPQIPKAYAIINPKQTDCTFPYKEICGAQIVWYLIASLKNTLNIKIDMMAYMELVAIAIIADVMPLKHINRTMVIAGLQRLSKSQRPSVRAYKEYIKKEQFSSEDIGFFLAPLLNSAGRMDDASYAVNFLISTNIYDARVHLQQLISFNEARKMTEETITKMVLESIDTKAAVTVVSGKGWHEGVVGIVAARVARKIKRPCIVLSDNGKGVLKGSGRSFGNCDLFATVNPFREQLEKFGGHAMAIGLSLRVEVLEAFKHSLRKHYVAIEEQNSSDELIGTLHFKDISFALTSLIKRFEPFGHSNPTPRFYTPKVCILQSSPMGKEGNHLRFLFKQDGIVHQGVQFRANTIYAPNTMVDIIYTVNKNIFRGDISLQLMVDEIIIL